jgi:hypothetical protein
MKNRKNLIIIAVQQKIIKAGFTRNIYISLKARLLLIFKIDPGEWLRHLNP